MFSAKEAKEKSITKMIKKEDEIFNSLKKETKKIIKRSVAKGETSVAIKSESPRALKMIFEWLNSLGFQTSEPIHYFFQYTMNVYWDEV